MATFRYIWRRSAVGPWCLALLLIMSGQALGHGGVVYEDDQCVLKMEFLTAHFTGFQPQRRGGEEFCEDIPQTGESIFVIEYLHDYMREMPVEFRVVRDLEGFGVYANYADVLSMGDLSDATVFALPAQRYTDGVLTARYDFQEVGEYIGIVSATDPASNKVYNAVFFFRVGPRNYWSVVALVLAVVVVQLGYLASTGSLQRYWRRRRERRATHRNT